MSGGLGRGKSIDDALIEGAVLELSAEEISERIGRALSPARVMQKTRELLKAGDWLDENERERALLRVLQKRIVELQSTTDLDAIKVQAAMVKDLLVQLNKRRAALEVDLNTYSTNVGRQLGQVVDLALTYMKGALREEVDPEKWDGLVMEALLVAQREIEKKQVEE